MARLLRRLVLQCGLVTAGVAACIGVSGNVARSEVLLERAVVLTGEWYPFASEELAGSGELSALVTRALKGGGLVPDYQFLPFSVVLDRTWAGDAIGTFPWFRTAEREARFLYSRPIIDVEYVIYYNREAGSGVSEVATFQQLVEFRTVRVKGYAYGKLDCVIDRKEGPDCAGDTLADSRADSEFAALQLLAAGKVDYFAASRSVARSVIERSFGPEDRRKFAVLEGDAFRWRMDLHFLFPRNRSDAAELKQAFDHALEELAAGGQVAEVRQRLDTFAYTRDGLVHLVVPDSGALEARRDLDSDEVVVLPPGSRAVVLRWSDAFLESAEAGADIGSGLTRVQLVNGPLRGARVWVPDRAIELE